MGKFLKQVYKNPSAFECIDEVKNDGRFMHNIYKAKKMKKNQNSPASHWYVKFLGENRIEALAETLTQEGMRLILPQQPKTRRLIEITPERRIVYSVVSKVISNFNDKFFLSPTNNERVLDSSITGLAATQVLSLWLNEVDFKAGNVGINQDGEVIKIDGGLGFITLNPSFNYLHEKDYRITSEDLEALPNLIHYQACNWLHTIGWNEQGYAEKKEPTELDKRINQNANFKKEVYQTILRIISLPNKLIRFFTNNYITNSTDVLKFSNFMIQRKQQLEVAANQISDFTIYRVSTEGQKEIFNFLDYLRTFRTMKKVNLLTAFHSFYGLNSEEIIIEKEIHHMINALSSELNAALENLNLKLKDNPVDMELLNLKELIFYINYLKNSIVNYSASQNNSKKDNFFNIITTISDTLKEDFLRDNSIVSNIIESISKILSYKVHLQLKVVKPFFASSNAENLPSLPPITFFNKKQLFYKTEINYSKATESIFSHSRD